MWNSLRVRLILILIALAIVPLIVVGAISLQTANTADRAQAIVLESQVAQNTATQVSVYLQGLSQNLVGLGDQISGLSAPDRTIYTNLISFGLNFAAYGNDFDELTLLDPQGHEIVRATHQGVTPDSQLLDDSKSDVYVQPVSTRQIYFSSVSFDSSTRQSYFTISIPLLKVSNNGPQLTGVLIGKVNVSQLENLLAEARPALNQSLYITDANGKVIASPFSTFYLQNVHVTLPVSGAIQIGLEHTNVALAIRKVYIGNQTLNVVAEEPTSIALSLVSNLVNTLVFAILIFLLLSVAVGFALARQIVLPIERLAVTAKQIAAGDLSQTVSIHSRDEIGSLANTFNDMTSQLRSLVGSLEQRVAERTEELERASLRVRTAAEIARDISSASDLDELLKRSSELIINRFNFYHTGIFLLDDKKEYAVLRASPSEAGKQLIANSHRLRVGEQGIVGRVAASGEARIALDTGADAVYFNNPFLPTTRSEMALPLKTRNEIFGVLDIQSDQPRAFVQEDIEILQVLADQLAIAIERINLLERVENQLKEIEQAYQEFTRRSWQGLARNQTQVAGYRFDGMQLQPINQAPENLMGADQPGIENSSQTESGNSESQAIPIRLRGQIIGTVTLRSRNNTVPKETIAIVEQIADRLASALENARLTEDTRRRGQRERAISEVSTKLSAFSDADLIMRSAVEELGRRLGSSAEVTLELGSDNQEKDYDKR